MVNVITGAEHFLTEPPRSLQKRPLGLLANPTSITRSLKSVVHEFANHPQLELVALFGPEHGVFGNAQAGERVKATMDAASGLPVFSLFGDTNAPTEEMLGSVEVIAIDIQDIGVRYATYLSTVANVLESCAEFGTQVMILDRPNPLGGVTVAGNVLEPEYISFVGRHRMPILHGLTIGEFARLFSQSHGLPDPLIIPMSDWSRELWYDQCGLPWVLPSPNLPTLDSVAVYPATCLLEGANVSEGRGTTRPFEIVGAPYIDADLFAHELTSLALAGIGFRPVWFRPTFSKHAGTLCAGVQIHIMARDEFDPIALGVHLLATICRLYPDEFCWLEPTNHRYFIDSLAGTDRLRCCIERGCSVGPLLDSWRLEAAEFKRLRSDILLY